MSRFVWNWRFFLNWLEKWSISFRNNTLRNISMVSDFECINVTINYWLDMFSCLNLSIICFLNWNESFTINNNWFNILICCWNEMISVDLNNWFWMYNRSNFGSEYLSEIFMNSIFRNIVDICNLKNIYFNCAIYRNFFQCFSDI